MTLREIASRNEELFSGWASRLVEGETIKSIAISAGVSRQYVQTRISKARLPEILRLALTQNGYVFSEPPMTLRRVNARLNEQGLHWCNRGRHVVPVTCLIKRDDKYVVPLCRECRNRRPYQKNKINVNARQAVARALRLGRLARPSICSACNELGKTAAHHSDYTRPLHVQWLCHKCHVRLHNDDSGSVKSA